MLCCYRRHTEGIAVTPSSLPLMSIHAIHIDIRYAIVTITIDYALRYYC